MIKDVAARVQRIKPSPTLSVSAKANALIAAGQDVINLSVGEPDFDTPCFIKEAAIQAIQAGMTKYTEVDGTLSLKKAIINKFKRDNQLDYTPEQIIVSTGAKQSLYNLFSAILNPGDEVIIPAPYWVSYPDMAKLADGIPVIVKTDFDQHFKMTPAQLDAAITPQTRLIILNSPSNPTGVTYTLDELKKLGEVIAQYPNIAVASDDIYEHTLWGKTPFANILMACPELYEQTIIINGVSKAYAMTGWRIGYAAGPLKVIAAMKKIQSQSTSNPTSISQAAAETALNGDQSCITTMTNAYKERHDYILEAIQSIPGFECHANQGTFYHFVRIEGLLQQHPHLENDLKFAEYLLNEAKVAIIPGSAFGAPGYIRLSYAAELGLIKKAMQRIQTSVLACKEKIS